MNIFFFVFHSVLIIFNLTGWIWEKTRLANLITLSLTVLSWFVLGIWYGFGFCPCTEWHWQVRMRLGHYDMPASYVKFLIDSITGLDVNAAWVDAATLFGLVFAFIASAWVNYKERVSKDWRNQTI